VTAAAAWVVGIAPGVRGWVLRWVLRWVVGVGVVAADGDDGAAGRPVEEKASGTAIAPATIRQPAAIAVAVRARVGNRRRLAAGCAAEFTRGALVWSSTAARCPALGRRSGSFARHAR
jgi:hypothetical protein